MVSCDTCLANLSSQHRPEIVEAALDDCLQELGLDYLDVYFFLSSYKLN